ncbi:MAG: hypothetical protein KDJ52_29130 [Anaerolineae bacterium]|nr:hypothetical protein [Anaerolineae bacterium]
MTGFSAGPQALGYLYQIRYALYLILNSPEELELSIESLDDIVFEENGSPQELLQLKHHTTPASLTDSSSDLWKTIRIWSTNLRERKISLPNTVLTLVTTSQAPDDSIAALLRPDNNRQYRLAATKLLDIANTSTNTSLTSSFDAFKALTPNQQEILANSIQILDNSPSISDTTDQIKYRLNLTARRQYLDALYERLEGWWLDKMVRHLSGGSVDLITGFEVRDKIYDIAEQFRPEALPIDYLGAEPPTPPDPDADNRRFVMQLKEIAVNNRRIEKAILDYYRAFEQRSRWAREDLLIGDELEQYEKKLVDEWERFYLAMQDDLQLDEATATEQDLKQFGREVYRWVDQVAKIHIRPRVTEEYVMRGSFHILADHNPPGVWWHPLFVKRLQQLLPV